ncbi:flagellar brake protein [uncultured Pseudokineococcus sp.]|uniref:flagellar brake protein n=1 Tax=uncultured Pseudokineococcus sp. TaxID=1642928 RepID=UPI0026243153|nr:PilZ domain-containing protein [uncultured Pseudokineococcus sp.]
MSRSTSTAARPHLPVEEAPSPGELLDVSLHRAGVPLTARVLGVEPDRLLLAPPEDVGGVPSRLVEGERVDLLRTDGCDLVGIPVVVQRTGGSDWSAVVVGPPQRVQRRDAVRIPMDARAVLVGARRAAPGPQDGEVDAADGDLEVPVLDLSEGGARCLVDPVVVGLEQGGTVRLQLPVEGLSAPVRARVVHRRFRHGTRHVDVGLRFLELGEDDADALRRHVFTRMWELRRRGDL